MRLLKLAAISFVVLFILVTAISFLVPSHIRISKAINIKTTPDSIWNWVDDLSKWEQWNPLFNGIDKNKMTWLDTSGGKGNAVKVATTTVKWKEKKEGEHIASMQNGDRKPVITGWKCMPHPGIDSITVQWWMDFSLRWYPWEKFGSLIFERTYGIKMEKGLSNLKTILEK